MDIEDLTMEEYFDLMYGAPDEGEGVDTDGNKDGEDCGHSAV